MRTLGARLSAGGAQVKKPAAAVGFLAPRFARFDRILRAPV
jgi:hypothetical protein